MRPKKWLPRSLQAEFSPGSGPDDFNLLAGERRYQLRTKVSIG
jgi:hypothetical protein